MDWMSRSDVLLFGFAAYVAVMTLVRLMQRRREQLVADIERQIDARRKHAKKRRAEREAA